MIKKINIQDFTFAKKILQLQKIAYQVESKLIQYYNIPPLIENLDQLVKSEETFISFEIKDKIVGFLSYQINQEKIEICRLAVNPNYFKNGIATKLMMHLSSIKNIKQHLVSTAEKNVPATTFYIKNGFIETHKSKVDHLILVHLKKEI